MKSLSLTTPHMIIMVGLPGSGKSFFAEKFASTFGAPYVSTDTISSLGVLEPRLIEAMCAHMLEELLKTKQSIIVECPAATRTERLELAKKARANGYEPLIVWVQTDSLTTKTRATRDKTKHGGIITDEQYERALKRFTAPNSLEKPVVISGKHTYASQAKVVLQKLSAPRAEISTHQVAPIRKVQQGRRNITIR